MAEVPLRWGIVGFGWVARDFMLPAMAAAGQTLVAVCDPDPRARDRARALGIAAHEQVEQLARDRTIEAVYVATPNHVHRAATEALARAGKAILCEKPMATSLADARAMTAACDEAGVLYGTAFDQRHHSGHRAIRGALRAGDAGRVTAVRIVYACWLGSDWAGASGRENWRVDRAKAGGGALIDLAPHGLDLVQFLLDEPIEKVAALTQNRIHDYAVDDGGVLIGSTRSGVLVTLHVAYNCPESLPRRRLEVLGSKGQIVAENTMGQEAGGTVVFTEGATGASTVLDVPDSAASPFLNQVLAFGEAFRSGDRTAFSGERDVHTMALIDHAYRSARASEAA